MNGENGHRTEKMDKDGRVCGDEENGYIIIRENLRTVLGDCLTHQTTITHLF